MDGPVVAALALAASAWCRTRVGSETLNMPPLVRSIKSIKQNKFKPRLYNDDYRSKNECGPHQRQIGAAHNRSQ